MRPTASRSAVCVVRIEATSSGVLITLRLAGDVEGGDADTVERFTDVPHALRRVHDFVVDVCHAHGPST